ncbi:MAG: ATP-binding protein [Salibacteraceae bacterium]
MTFRKRIYLSMILVVLVSFAIIGTITIWYTQYENEKYHLERLERKERAIMVSLKYFLASHQNDSLAFYTRDLHLKVEEVADINKLDIILFDLSGQSFAASDYGFFDLGYIPNILPKDVLQELESNNGSLVNEVAIGEENYLFALKYLESENGEPLAIIHVPYFRSEQEFKEETTVFLQALTQVYAFLLVLGLLIAYLLSNSITKGLKRLEEKIKVLTLQGDNQEVEWSGNDEISSLVDAYNQKVRELESSVDLLAQSQRESAWREMAKQVAHEIKNPLTPMLLQVQMLERSWKDGREDFSARMDKFHVLMTEQIETLSRIATEFSNFAKLPEAQLEDVSVNDSVNKVCSLFNQNSAYTLEVNLCHENAFISADKNQMVRVLNNLIMNAVQAVEGVDSAKISVVTNCDKNDVTIKITDNGIGIERLQISRIFEPNFTTKTGGTGLGLAMVKSIINNIGGEISVTSEKGNGSTFILNLPRLK